MQAELFDRPVYHVTSIVRVFLHLLPGKGMPITRTELL